MPFFQIWGYDVFNSSQYTPKFTANMGINKGEKVAYAIILNEKASIYLIDRLNELLE